ncbi:Uncharacterised protein [Alcaligenes faecalis subsp. faecalis]|nr:Uncharacterised protein [Alcaligenes faecalis subsp. faecalis]
MQDGVHHGFEPEFCIRRRTPRNIFKSRQRQRSQAGLHRILVSAAKQSRANTLSLPIAMNRKLPNVKLMIQNFGIQKSDQVVLRCLSDPNASLENEPLMFSPRDDLASCQPIQMGDSSIELAGGLFDSRQICRVLKGGNTNEHVGGNDRSIGRLHPRQ